VLIVVIGAQPCEVVLIPKASHCAHEYNPALVTQQLADF